MGYLGMASVSVFRFLLFFHVVLLLSAGYGNGKHVKCPRSFDCGKLGSIPYFPFTKPEQPHCGFITIHGCDDPFSDKKIQLEKNGTLLLLTKVLQLEDNIIKISVDHHQPECLEFRTCEVLNESIALPPKSPLASFHSKHNVTLFQCNHGLHLNTTPHDGFISHACSPVYDIYFPDLHSDRPPPPLDSQRFFSACSTLQLPCKDLTDTSDPVGEMEIEVQLSDDCHRCYNQKGGQCQVGTNNNFGCDTAENGKWGLELGLGALSIGIIMLLSLAYCFKQKLVLTAYSFFRTKNNPTHQTIEDLLKKNELLPSRRYTYSEIQKITNNFIIKLGQGGYGSVYKGWLRDGQLVAVKVLSELKGTGEEFINEVASISRTSHVNIVNLLGFCFQGSKRALIYEFMPNGSLEKFIFETNENMVDHQLDCKILFNIAIGVARGLEYLHKGCNTRILHFDIKPHNILLDENFCPKISDFGLAKICLRRESIVSLLGARGTAGYIAPEIFSRSFGEVSHKSDVYSYGMMVMEMVGGRRSIDVEVGCSSEIYFPRWIYKRLALNEELRLKCIKDDNDKEIIRKMIMVSLWCIQTNPLSQLAVSRVVEMLEGSLESLQVPPKPYLASPSMSPIHYSSQTCETLEL